MINDADRDNNYLLLPEATILEERYTWKKATASEATPIESPPPVMQIGEIFRETFRKTAQSAAASG